MSYCGRAPDAEPYLPGNEVRTLGGIETIHRPASGEFRRSPTGTEVRTLRGIETVLSQTECRVEHSDLEMGSGPFGRLRHERRVWRAEARENQLELRSGPFGGLRQIAHHPDLRSEGGSNSYSRSSPERSRSSPECSGESSEKPGRSPESSVALPEQSESPERAKACSRGQSEAAPPEMGRPRLFKPRQGRRRFIGPSALPPPLQGFRGLLSYVYPGLAKSASPGLQAFAPSGQRDLVWTWSVS